MGSIGFALSDKAEKISSKKLVRWAKKISRWAAKNKLENVEFSVEICYHSFAELSAGLPFGGWSLST